MSQWTVESRETLLATLDERIKQAVEQRIRKAETFVPLGSKDALRLLVEVQVWRDIASDLFVGMHFVQYALACDRDEQQIIHPVHGPLALEEVKYMVVDPLCGNDE